jgi:hypothetical protein
LNVIAADRLGGLLQAHVRLEPARQHVLVVVPPAGLVGPGGQGQDLLPLAPVGDPVELEKVGDVDLTNRVPAQLNAADLGL